MNRWTYFALGLLLGLLAGWFVFGYMDTYANEKPEKIWWCHVTPSGNEIQLHLPLPALMRAGHVNAQGNPLHAGDYRGRCEKPEPTPTPTPEPTVRLCHCEDKDECEAIAVTEKAAKRHLKAHQYDHWWEEGMDKNCEFPPKPTPTPEPTKRWCFPCQMEVKLDNGIHKYCADAIPQSQNPEIGFPWETGMDKYCEFPPEPTPTVTPVPEKPADPPKTNTTSFTPNECKGATPVAPVCTVGYWDGDTAVIQWNKYENQAEIMALHVRYGCSPNSLDYTALNLPKDAMHLDVNGLDCPHIYYQVWAESNGFCYSEPSQTCDP